MIRWIYDDGGRANAGFKGDTGDCVCRSIAIASRRPYREIYDLLNKYALKERPRKHDTRSNARTGVKRDTIKKVMKSLGAEWTPTMFVGSGCQVHLKTDELPSGRIVVNLSRHIAAVIDGNLHDTYDCSREGTRCVYGYWTFN